MTIDQNLQKLEDMIKRLKFLNREIKGLMDR